MCPRAPIRIRTISETFTDAERERFHNLLSLAAESPFDGERENALAAAKRLAGKYGMSLEEAAMSAGPGRPQPPPVVQWSPDASFAEAMHLMDYHLHTDKMRRDAALREARARGLDAEEAARTRPPRPLRQSKARMDPVKHARTLLRETSLPFQEIAKITGLDVYQVVGMKLKMRKAA